MPLFQNTRLEGDEKELEKRLMRLFSTSKDKIRWDRNVKNDCTVHSIKNKRTRNTVVIKDYREHGNLINVVIHTRLKHCAANIENDSAIVVNEMYSTFNDLDMAAKIGVYLTEESEFSKTPFRPVKMTKKRVEDLADDEVTGGFIEKVGHLTSLGVPYMELSWENGSGRLLEPADKINKRTSNPVGTFVVVNKHYNIAFFQPERFAVYFRPSESPDQVSQPADLFDPALTQPGALI